MKMLNLFFVISLASCAVANEDELAACEKRVAELEREVEDCSTCYDDLAKTTHDALIYKEIAENCVDRKVKGRH